jgi:hypothetical protein
MKRRGHRGSRERIRGERSLQRRPLHRPEKTRILIVCEGKETEPNYFRRLRDEDAVRQNFNIVVKKGKGGSLAVVEQAIDELEKAAARREDFDEAWCVFDIEQASRQRQVIEARMLAGQHDIKLALSNPAFEVWILAHFVRTKKSFADCDKVIAELNKHWRGAWQQEYEKNDEQIYARLAGRTPAAIDNARKVRTRDWHSSADIIDCNSATDVYLLVELMLGPSAPSSP